MCLNLSQNYQPDVHIYFTYLLFNSKEIIYLCQEKKWNTNTHCERKTHHRSQPVVWERCRAGSPNPGEKQCGSSLLWCVLGCCLTVLAKESNPRLPKSSCCYDPCIQLLTTKETQGKRLCWLSRQRITCSPGGRRAMAVLPEAQHPSWAMLQVLEMSITMQHSAAKLLTSKTSGRSLGDSSRAMSHRVCVRRTIQDLFAPLRVSYPIRGRKNIKITEWMRW